jgi:hypothetical protein
MSNFSSISQLTCGPRHSDMIIIIIIIIVQGVHCDTYKSSYIIVGFTPTPQSFFFILLPSLIPGIVSTFFHFHT